MKNSIIYLLLVSLFLFSCEDFLEEKPKDRIIPEAAEDYRELLYGEAYFKGNDVLAYYLDVMSDDCKSNANIDTWSSTDTRNLGFGYYTWQANPEQPIEGAMNDDFVWEELYHSILTCNIVLNDIDGMPGKVEEKEDIKAEAHFIRAFDYFMLVNMYGLPYRKATADQDMGVPISDVTGMEDRYFERASVAAVYKQIEYDLTESIRLFQSSDLSKTIFRANINAAYLLASRVALYQKKYADVIEFSNKVIENNPTIWDIKNLDYSDYNSRDYLISKKNPELIFTYASEFNTFYNVGALYNFVQSDELMDLFTEDDSRAEFFMPTPKYYWDSRVPMKNQKDTKTQVFGYAFRTVEAYLNRAEAYAAEASTIGKAMDDINHLREHRLTTTEDLTAASVDEAIEKVREERRRELCFEQQRWFDLRRFGCPRIEHVYIKDATTNTISTYVLEKDDPAYTLPIPFSVIQFRPSLGNIARPERNPL